MSSGTVQGGQGTAIIAAGALAEILTPHLILAIAGMAATAFAALLAVRAPAANRAAAAV